MNCTCSYCINVSRPPWIWRLNSGTAWIEVPRNASSAIKRKNNLLEANRSFAVRDKRIKNVKDLKSGEPVYYVWKDPVKRFESTASAFFIEGNDRYKFALEWFNRLNLDINKYSFHEKVDLLFERGDEVVIKENHHFYPQRQFIPINDGLNIVKIPIWNLSGSAIDPNDLYHYTTHTSTITPEQRSHIAKIYEMDYLL